MEGSDCEVLRNILDFAAANLREGEKLPEAVAKLIDTYPYPEGFWDTSKEYEISKKCAQTAANSKRTTTSTSSQSGTGMSKRLVD